MGPSSPEPRISLQPKNTNGLGGGGGGNYHSTLKSKSSDGGPINKESFVSMDFQNDNKENNLPNDNYKENFDRENDESMSFETQRIEDLKITVGAEVTVLEESSSSSISLISYEEIIHESHYDEYPCENIQLTHPSLRHLLLTLTEWTLALREVVEEQSLVRQEGRMMKCQCFKFAFCEKELRVLDSTLRSIYSSSQRASSASAPFLDSAFSYDLNKLKNYLKSHISIQISRPSFEIISKSKCLFLASSNVFTYGADVIESLIKLIRDIFFVSTCSVCRLDSSECIREKREGIMEEDEEEAMSLLVASLYTSASSSALKNRRKRKQILPIKNPSYFLGSGPSGPCKRMKREKGNPFIILKGSDSETNHSTETVIDILEKNKKMVKTNGLYQFVLWREALKAEKDRAGTFKILD